MRPVGTPLASGTEEEGDRKPVDGEGARERTERLVQARLLHRFRWIAYVGLAVIVYVAGKMIYDGWVHPDVGLGRLFA